MLNPTFPMKKILQYGLLAVVLGLGSAVPAAAQKQSTPSSLLRYNSNAVLVPGDGYLTGADIWHSVKPSNTETSDRLGNAFSTVGGGMNNRILMGSRGNWQEPVNSWPSGFPYTNSFRNSGFIVLPLFKASGWPGYGAGNPVRARDGSTDTKGQNGTSRFMFATYGPNVPGANDPQRNYKRPARYTDATRTELVYEAGWPTSAGVDVKVRARQYTPNTQNLNDFTVLEITLTNTGVVDSNGDGTPEATNNVVDGAGMMLDATVSPAIFIGTNGDRACNCIAAGRTFGYVAAADETGAPFNYWAWFANIPPTQTAGRTVPPAGQRSFGIDNRNQLHGYTDVWNGWNFMGVKRGALDENLTASSPDKQTVFGTHPVGEGSRRGWYTSVQWQSPLSSLSSSDVAFRNATATWYEDYGKTSNGGSVPTKLGPNPAFFSGGQPDDITTWTVGNPNARPNGDFKYASQDLGIASIEQVQPVWEPAWNTALRASAGDPNSAKQNPSDADFYNGIQGFAREYTFGQALTQGIGPFRLEVGESITIVWVSAAGFRFKGLDDAMDAARWAWERGWNVRSALPVPAAPEMKVESTTNGTAVVRWTDVSNLGQISGYKIWRAAQYKRTSYFDAGLRLVDNYQRQHETGAVPDNLLDPINPYFDAFDIFSGDIQGTYQPAEWGTYDLVAKIPTGQLSQYQSAGGPYQYAYEDTDAITGFTYWYYVSAYRDGTFSGPQGNVGTHLESANLNRNGRNAPDAPEGTIGLGTPWSGTYPYATRNALFPAESDVLGLKNIGAAFTVTPPVAPTDQVASLVTVSPNPYKVTGLNDVRNDPSSHSVDFLGLPADYTLTIMDVSGQIIFQTVTEGAVNGKYTWDLFSKDGVEVASGLYIYHVAYSGGEVTGHLAILR